MATCTAHVLSDATCTYVHTTFRFYKYSMYHKSYNFDQKNMVENASSTLVLVFWEAVPEVDGAFLMVGKLLWW